jgi:hypothetical protein
MRFADFGTGEIDPDPETKPARRDQIDMDKDSGFITFFKFTLHAHVS